MRKILFLMIAFALSGLSSCKKVWDYIKDHPDGTADNCKIEKVAFKWFDIINNGPVINDTATIMYNPNGDPVSVLYSSGGKTTAVWNNKAFKYDSQHRLIAYLEDATPGFEYGDYWHKYVYTGTNIVVDTTFVYANGDFFSLDRPIIIPGEVEPEIRISKYTLDSYGRIIKSEGAYTGTFTYNAAGNLVLPDVTYTDKTNIKQTHKTWMFIARDYSVNAPVGQATQYNANKLPVKATDIDIFPIGYWDAGTMGDRQVRVTYICK
ncbi:MAG: hypothetical protein QM668_09805 [Agriterribacter sp.]